VTCCRLGLSQPLRLHRVEAACIPRNYRLRSACWKKKTGFPTRKDCVHANICCIGKGFWQGPTCCSPAPLRRSAIPDQTAKGPWGAPRLACFYNRCERGLRGPGQSPGDIGWPWGGGLTQSSRGWGRLRRLRWAAMAASRFGLFEANPGGGQTRLPAPTSPAAIG